GANLRGKALLNPEAELPPLVDAKTGDTIESFPKDLEAFYQLNVSEMLYILRALDLRAEKVGVITAQETLRNIFI
ncbi:unnamed protein product, partial [Clonostachys byssicola]